MLLFDLFALWLLFVLIVLVFLPMDFFCWVGWFCLYWLFVLFYRIARFGVCLDLLWLDCFGCLVSYLVWLVWCGVWCWVWCCRGMLVQCWVFVVWLTSWFLDIGSLYWLCLIDFVGCVSVYYVILFNWFYALELMCFWCLF